jgi:hypothetical protein
MEGHNELRINEATIIRIVDEYLQAKAPNLFVKSKVTSVKMITEENQSVFVVGVAKVEKGAAERRE